MFFKLSAVIIALLVIGILICKACLDIGRVKVSCLVSPDRSVISTSMLNEKSCGLLVVILSAIALKGILKLPSALVSIAPLSICFLLNEG